MPLRDILKKKDRIKQDDSAEPEKHVAEAPQPQPQPPPPQFTFLRTTTDLEEVISPPSFPADNNASSQSTTPHLTVDKSKRTGGSRTRRLFHRSKSPQDPSPEDNDDNAPVNPSPPSSKSDDRRLSRRIEEKLHINRTRAESTANSMHVPEDLPDIDKVAADNPEAETEWEKRALLLANKNQTSRTPTPNAAEQGQDGASNGALSVERPPMHKRTISNPESDINIQEAIRLHEAGGKELERSTTMFKSLADPKGENNVLAQVLYGLALRHGWGCEPDPATALTYLSMAASNSALVESAAISAGAVKGGAAKGELVLAIYELGNSFRHGWGCDKDPVAARKYYETAANLGDTDAMSEVAWCYLEAFGGKKDKFKAAQYLKMAEKKGVSEPGNSWIWKEKYSEPSKS